MSEQGAALQTYNQELVKHIEEMKSRRELLQKSIELEEAQKISLQCEIDALNAKMTDLNAKLALKISTKRKLDRVISETESTYSKIIESSQALLFMAKQEAADLNILNQHLIESPD